MNHRSRSFVLSVAALAAATLGSAAAQQVERIEPVGAYTQVVTTTDRGVKTVFVSGQVGEGDDFAAHVESAFTRVVGRLEQAGASVDDVVKIRAFVVDLTPELYRTVADVRRRTFAEGSWPASTVAGVQALARDGFRDRGGLSWRLPLSIWRVVGRAGL